MFRNFKNLLKLGNAFLPFLNFSAFDCVAWLMNLLRKYILINCVENLIEIEAIKLWLNIKMLGNYYSKTISQMIRLRSHIASIWRKLDDFLKSIAYDFGSLLSSRFIAVKKRLLVITTFNAQHILVSSFTSKTFKFTMLKVWSISWNLHELKRYFIIWRCWIRWNFGPV